MTGGLSTEGYVGKCRLCMGTQSDPTILCSQTASAMYLGSNKSGGGAVARLAWSPSAWGAHSPRPGPVKSWYQSHPGYSALAPHSLGQEPFMGKGKEVGGGGGFQRLSQCPGENLKEKEQGV